MSDKSTPVSHIVNEGKRSNRKLGSNEVDQTCMRAKSQPSCWQTIAACELCEVQNIVAHKEYPNIQ